MTTTDDTYLDLLILPPEIIQKIISQVCTLQMYHIAHSLCLVGWLEQKDAPVGQQISVITDNTFPFLQHRSSLLRPSTRHVEHTARGPCFIDIASVNLCPVARDQGF